MINNVSRNSEVKVFADGSEDYHCYSELHSIPKGARQTGSISMAPLPQMLIKKVSLIVLLG